MLSTHVLEDNGQRIGLDLEPRHSSIAPPPSHLAARVPAIGPGHRLRKFLEGQFAVDVGEGFGVADAGEDWSALRHAGVESRAALGDRHASALLATSNGMASSLDVLARVESLRRLDEADHVISDALSSFRTRLIGRDVQPLVDLLRVGHHDLATELKGQSKGEMRLSDAGRTDDDGNPQSVVASKVAAPLPPLRPEARGAPAGAPDPAPPCAAVSGPARPP